jgi:pimeloyl-ACP methyl ester carboxylesterase
MEIRAMTVTISGAAGHLYVDDGGTGGIPVVFVHSFSGSSAHWKAQLDHLRRTRRAIAIDLRGHGHSDAPAGGMYEVTHLACDIASVVDRLELERFVLVGHSMGGSAAIAYAGTRPGRVAGLVLVGTPGRAPDGMGDQILGAMEQDYDKVAGGYWDKLLGGSRPEVGARVRADMARIPRDASLSMIRAVFDFDPTSALQSYPGPKLLIDTPHGDGPASLHAQHPDTPREVIEGTSHWVQMDAPERFNAVLDRFLEGVS